MATVGALTLSGTGRTANSETMARPATMSGTVLGDGAKAVGSRLLWAVTENVRQGVEREGWMAGRWAGG